MTATLINIVPAQAIPDPAGPAAAGSSGAAPAAPANRVPPGDPRVFAAAMQSLRNPYGERVSAIPAGADGAVTGLRATPAGRLAELFVAPDPAVGIGPPAEPLPVGIQNTDGSADPARPETLPLPAGNALPDTGNVLPLPARSTVAVTAGDGRHPDPVADGVPAAKAGLVNRWPSTAGLPGRSSPPAGPDGPPATAERPLPPADAASAKVSMPADSAAMKVLASADKPASEPASPGFVFEDEMTGSPAARRAFETAMARTEPLPGTRSAAIASFAAAGGESALTGPAPVAGQSPGALPAIGDAAPELPQFQAMRPLQPTADPQGFVAGLGQRLMVMSGQGGVQSARLQLHPENLGSLDVTIQIEEDTARVWFNAQHGQTREILESALPRLRDLFAQQGMALLEADVGSGSDRQRTNDAFDGIDAPCRDGMADGDQADAPEQPVPVIVRQVSDRVLDVYA